MLAIIAHDAKKEDMLEFVKEHLDVFSDSGLVATGNTGRMLTDQLDSRLSESLIALTVAT